MTKQTFSFYKAPIGNLKPLKEMNLIEAYDLIKSNEYEEITNKVRNAKNEEEQGKIKKNKLDYITFGGTFEKRAKADIILQSGYVAIDIDHISKNIEELKEELKKDKYVKLLFKSPSGEGLKIIIEIPLGLNEFEQRLMSFYYYLSKQYDIPHRELDTKTKDVSRACFLCYDPDAYLNLGAEIYKEKTDIGIINQKMPSTKFDKNKILKEGIKEGERNISALYLALDRKKAKIPREITISEIISLRDKNPKAEDPFPDEEITRVVNSAYSYKTNEEEIKEEIEKLTNDSVQPIRRHILKLICEKEFPKVETERYLKQIAKKTGTRLKLIQEEYNTEAKAYSKEVKKSKKPLNISEEEQQEIEEKLKNPELIKFIWEELDKTHKLDHKEKLAVFLIRLTAELKNPEDRCSVALKGNSSAGKDNIIRSVLNIFPKEDSFLLTRGTQSALEEESQKVKAIAFSEMNANREDGANKDLTEFFKQLSEGGVKIIKRDKQTNEVITLESEQKTLMYGTTEAKSDDELETRYVIIPIRSDEEKNRIVVQSYLKSLSDIKKITDKKQSWVINAIKLLKKDYEIMIPYAEALEGEYKTKTGIKESLFDMKKDRIKRDIKRLFNITKAITLLYQLQRKTFKDEETEQEILISQPEDFKLAFMIMNEFMEDTYLGLDFREKQVYDKIREQQGKQDDQILSYGYSNNYYGWVLRHKIQELLGIESKNTIKSYLKTLKDRQLIEEHYEQNIPRGVLLKHTGGQQGVNRGSEGVRLTGIDTLLTPYLTPSEKSFYGYVYDDGESSRLSYEKMSMLWGMFFQKLTPSKLTPSISPQTHTPICIKENVEEVDLSE